VCDACEYNERKAEHARFIAELDAWRMADEANKPKTPLESLVRWLRR
jgi:hypothetical protein